MKNHCVEILCPDFGVNGLYDCNAMLNEWMNGSSFNKSKLTLIGVPWKGSEGLFHENYYTKKKSHILSILRRYYYFPILRLWESWLILSCVFITQNLQGLTTTTSCLKNNTCQMYRKLWNQNISEVVHEIHSEK